MWLPILFEMAIEVMGSGELATEGLAHLLVLQAWNPVFLCIQFLLLSISFGMIQSPVAVKYIWFFFIGNGNSFPATYLCIQCQQHPHWIHQLWSVRHPSQTDPEDPVSSHWYPESLQLGALHLPQVRPRLSACTQMLQGAGGEPVLQSFWRGQ